MPSLIDGPAAALILGVAPATINTWAKRGKLTRHGRDHRGRTLYDLTELHQIADARARRAAQRATRTATVDADQVH